MYKGILKESGTIVNKEKAFIYAIQRVLHGTKEERLEFEEWFYSGDWVEEKEEIL